MSDQLLSALTAIIAGIGVCVMYFWGANWLLTTVGLSGFSERKAIQIKNRIHPWLFILPALLFLILFLIYPAVKTVWLSLHDKNYDAFVGIDNYTWIFHFDDFIDAVQNNILWLLIVPFACTVLGLLIAKLTDRLWWGVVAKSLIFMPMAISFIGASVIWKFVYEYRDPSLHQIGILNALITSLGFEPKAWITIPFWNNIFLMVILIWIQTGFAMVVLGAALRGIPNDTIEAARIDGAGPFQIFFKIMVPQILETVLVVWTTITIFVLKVFDIVLAMTNGQWDTQVVANLMYEWMFRGGGDFGRGSTFAVVIMVAVIPVMVWNIRRFQKQKNAGML